MNFMRYNRIRCHERYNDNKQRHRDVAQFGRVLGLGPRCRRFEPCHLDHQHFQNFFLTRNEKDVIIKKLSKWMIAWNIQRRCAGVAQLVEQLICNQQVGGSSPSTSSKHPLYYYGGVPEWPKGADCKSVAFSFDGSNPSSPTKDSIAERRCFFYFGFFTELLKLKKEKCMIFRKREKTFTNTSCFATIGK